MSPDQKPHSVSEISLSFSPKTRSPIPSKCCSTAASSVPESDKGFRESEVDHEPIAVIGFSLKFPGDAASTESFWKLMMEGSSTASSFPKERFNHEAFYSSDPGSLGTIRPTKAHFLKDDPAAFDANFFNISQAEVVAMDPQQRALLERTYQALENAGIPMKSVDGSDVSVHIGCFTNDHAMLMCKDPESMPKYTATGGAATLLSNRISSFYNFKGPSVTIDTACSSSLVAVDQACQCLQLGQTSMAIVGGCNLLLAPDLTISLSNLGFLSPDGVCHSFDHRANGYARSEGSAVVILKRLSDAVRDNNAIRAVIRASGSNQDGRTPLAQPSSAAQTQLITNTYRKAHLDLALTRYVEAHGTGTTVGDPIEAHAIGTAFSAGRSKEAQVIVGSLKANFGHLEGGAGIAGLIKAVMCLERAIIPPLAGLEEVNPEIDTEFLNILFPKSPIAWPNRGLRRASVNSFGFGGTNAHVVLDDAYHFLRSNNLVGRHCTTILPPEVPTGGNALPLTDNDLNINDTSNISQLPITLVWSAMDEESLKTLHTEYEKWISRLSPKDRNMDLLSSLAHTLFLRRSILPWRSFAVIESEDGFLVPRISSPVKAKQVADLSLAFVFTGQGAQWCGMGKELLVYDVFRSSVVEAITYLMSLGCYSHLVGGFTGDLSPEDKIAEPDHAQPLCTILQVALVDLLASINVYPSVVVGHSSGEIAAAYACGAIDSKSAWKLAYFRGVCSTLLANSADVQGAMLSVGLSADETQRYILSAQEQLGHHGNLAVACINSPTNVTISGDRKHVQLLASQLNSESIFARILRVPVAYHGHHMKNISNIYLESIGQITQGDGHRGRNINMVSSVTGVRIEKEDLCDPSYWIENMNCQVKFMQAIQTIFTSSPIQPRKKLDLSHRKRVWATDLLEIGPHATLSGPIRESLKEISDRTDVQYYSALHRNTDARNTLLMAMSQLHCRGYVVPISELNKTPQSKDSPDLVLPDLPQYPFNHTTSLLYESSLSKGLRFRQYPRNPFLGTRSSDWSTLDARWRQVLNSHDSSWLLDHKVNSKILFPAAGMVVMAIEAAMEMTDTLNIVAFELSDTTFSSALEIPIESPGVEVQFRMIPNRSTTTKETLSWAFSLYAPQGTPSDICRGNIRAIQSVRTVNAEDKQHSTDYFLQRAIRHFDQAKTSHLVETLMNEDLYGRFAKHGYGYGPTFSRIKQLKYSSAGNGLAVVDLCSIEGQDHPTVVHPATLDSVFQVMLTGLVAKQDLEYATFLPSRIEKLWISRGGFLDENNKSLDVAVRVQKNGLRLTKATITAMTNGGSLEAFLEGIEGTSISDVSALIPLSKPIQLQCWNVVQKPDVFFADNSSLQDYLTTGIASRAFPTMLWNMLDAKLLEYLNRAEDQLTAMGVSVHLDYFANYRQWMQRQTKYSSSNVSLSPEDAGLAETISDDRFSRFQRFLEIYDNIGEHLPLMLSKTINPLEFLFRGNDMDDFYEIMFDMADFVDPLKRFLDLLAHKNPSMKVLEVGAGTGGATKRILKALARQETNGFTASYSKYCFTDISPSFFEKAQEVLGQFPKLQYATLDVERNPIDQGFEAESFDLIVASHVLHATSAIHNTLSNLSQLLKPGGKLILIEITNPDALGAGFLFGLLPGWWLSTEEWRLANLSPCLTPEKWQECLKKGGFSGVDHIFYDSSNECTRASSLILSSKQSMKRSHLASYLPTACLVSLGSGTDQLVQECQNLLSKLGVSASSRTLRDCDHDLSQDRVLLVVIDSPLRSALESIGETEWYSLRQALSRANDILWIVPGTESSMHQQICPSIYGLSRTLQSERASLNFTILELRAIRLSDEQSLHLSRVLEQHICPRSTSVFESEIVERDGMLHVNRIVQNHRLNHRIRDDSMHLVRKDVRFAEEDLVVTVQTPGLLDSLSFVKAAPRPSDIPPHDIQVRVKAIGINFRDCLTALGRVPAEDLGGEFAGIIVKVGSSSTYQPGDRVMGIVMGSFCSLMQCDESLVIKIPDTLSFAAASKLPLNIGTAYHALIEIGRLSKDETVLIHAGAGGTGQAAIQIAQNVGAEVFVTVGSQHKRDFVKTVYGIRDDHIFHSRDSTFAQGVRYMTNERGVDVILNSLAGEDLRASWECIAPHGRFLEIGKRDIFEHANLPMFQFARNVSFSAVDLSNTKQRPNMIKSILQSVLDLILQKKIKAPSPLKTYKVHEFEDALRYLQSGLNFGSVAIQIEDDDLVQAIIPPVNGPCLKHDATYVISGGLGGQGKSIAKWMAQEGAKNIILLSRNGRKTPGADEFIAQLRTAGVRAEAPTCDIADLAGLTQTIEDVAARFPPVKGCIQGAMSIQDALFETMTYEDWRCSTDPKVKGSWNLHQVLPLNLDFFILLSSVAGIIGSVGQSNYAAGNTYQDALAAYRVSIGQKAVSINLGIMIEEGYLKDKLDLVERMTNIKHITSMSQETLFSVLRHYCASGTRLSEMESQVVMGLSTPAEVHRKGLDEPEWMNRPLFLHLHQIDSLDTKAAASDSNQSQSSSIMSSLAAAKTRSEAGGMISRALQEKLAKIISVSPDDIDTNKPLHVHKVDSLVAVEIRNWFLKTMKADVPAFEILGGASIEALGVSVAEKLGYGLQD